MFKLEIIKSVTVFALPNTPLRWSHSKVLQEILPKERIIR